MEGGQEDLPCRPLTLGKGGETNKFQGTPAQWK
jgi:hypothetical protein